MRAKIWLSMLLSILVVVIIGLPACNLLGTGDMGLSVEERAQTSVAETLAVAFDVQTIVAGTLAAAGNGDGEPEATPVPEPTHTATLQATITPTPTIILTPTPDKPVVSVSVNTNCRQGPGLQYEIVGSLAVGEQAEVVGVAETGNYWVIRNPRRAGECWLWGQYATVVGQISGLPRRTPPPTPTPSFTPTPVYNWTGTWTTAFGVPGMMTETYIVTLNQTNGSVTGSFMIGAIQVNMNGTLSSDKVTLTGTWSSPGDSGVFTFQLVSLNQFVGNMNNRDYQWCGHREGAGLPSPCMGP